VNAVEWVLMLIIAFLLSFIYYGLHEFIFSDIIFENINPFVKKSVMTLTLTVNTGTYYRTVFFCSKELNLKRSMCDFLKSSLLQIQS
jgi:hypothetical protein